LFFRVKEGYAKIIDWHAGLLTNSEGPKAMEALRASEKDAKEHRRGVWKSYAGKVPAISNGGSSGTNNASSSSPKSWHGTVTRIWGGDALGIRKISNGTEETIERRIQLSSIRQPKNTDPKQAPLQLEAREFLRKRLIGKQVNVVIDYIKPKEGEFEERECATVTLPNGSNVALLLVEKGLAGVIRHRRDDEDRSPAYDSLLAAEQKAATEEKGIHSTKEIPSVKPPQDISESAAKANTFLNSFKRAGRISGVVDFVSSGSRFKIYLPKQDVKLTLVLAGIKAPRTARDVKDKSEPFGPEALNFTSRLAFQRDAEIEIENTDKSGGFVGVNSLLRAFFFLMSRTSDRKSLYQ
jgi:staphylococcal nuclease domain-containing protein 1